MRKKLMGVIVSTVFVFAVAISSHSAEKAEWDGCFSVKYVENLIQSFIEEEKAQRNVKIINEDKLKKLYFEDGIDFFEKSGTLCGKTQILTPQEIWKNTGIYLKNESSRWKDFEILVNKNGQALKEESPLSDYQSTFITLLAFQVGTKLLNLSERQELLPEDFPTLDELVAQLAPESQNKLGKISESWREEFRANITVSVPLAIAVSKLLGLIERLGVIEEKLP